MLWPGYPSLPQMERHLAASSKLLFALQRLGVNLVWYGPRTALIFWRLDWRQTKRTMKGDN